MHRFLFLLAIIFFGCSTSKKIAVHRLPESIRELRFVDEYDIPYNEVFRNTTVGGLSGIDYDPVKDVYYMISDDRSSVNPARFYTAKIHLNQDGIDSVQFLDVTTLLQKDGKPYPNSKQDPLHTPDPEALRYNSFRNEFVWSSEGERIVRQGNIVLEDPSVIAIDRDGHFRDSFALPSNMHMHSTESGPRQNGVFEGLSFSGDYKKLFVNVEEPIYEDGPRAEPGDSAAWIRIIEFDATSRQPLAQYAYRIEPVAYSPNPPGSFRINGIPDILWLSEKKFLVIERSFSTGRLACTIRLFLADMKGASDVKNITSLNGSDGFVPVSKKLLLNMDSLGRYIDNIEGVSFGPLLPNGHRSLLFIADNNFAKEEKAQVLLFEIVE
jgi:hypothetical protein